MIASPAASRPLVISTTEARLCTPLAVGLRLRGLRHPFKEETLGHLLARRPEEVVRRAVKGMLPRNRLGAQQLRKLKIYAGTDHPHQAQRPEPLA